MKPSKRVIASAFALCLAIGANAQWTVINLHPPGATSSQAFGVNGGQQVGYAMVAGVPHAALWNGTAASWVDLHPVGAANSHGYGVSGGQQVGFVNSGGYIKASLWSGTAASWVDLDTSGNPQSQAFCVNAGQQGGTETSSGTPRAALWSGSAGTLVTLHPAGVLFSYIRGLGEGQQAGWVTVSGPTGGIHHASLWSGTSASWVDLHPTGAEHSIGYGVHTGRQVGTVVVESGVRASLWSGTAASWVDLTPAGAKEAEGWAIENSDQVGWASFGKPGSRRAGIWSGTADSWVDLHAFLPTSFTISEASAIWHDGSVTYVVGSGYNSTTGRDEALMWVKAPLESGDYTLTLNVGNVAGQNSVLGTIAMLETKETNTIFTTYDNSSLITTPPTVTVLAGQLSRDFQITTTAITSTVVTTIYAKLGSLTRLRTLVISPLVPTALVFTPNPVTGGQPTSCRIVINGVAGPGGRVISVFDYSYLTTMPSTVTVPAGATEVSFPITTNAVTTTRSVTVTARVSAGEKKGTFLVKP